MHGCARMAPQVLQEDGQPVIVPTADGATLPSVVAFQDDGSVLVGKAAKRCATPAFAEWSSARALLKAGLYPPPTI